MPVGPRGLPQVNHPPTALCPLQPSPSSSKQPCLKISDEASAGPQPERASRFTRNSSAGPGVPCGTPSLPRPPVLPPLYAPFPAELSAPALPAHSTGHNSSNQLVVYLSRKLTPRAQGLPMLRVSRDHVQQMPASMRGEMETKGAQHRTGHQVPD